MSGIYGILGNESNAYSYNLSFIEKWNLAYGAESPVTCEDENIALGICFSHITAAPVLKSPIIARGFYNSVIDAIIYNRPELISDYSLSEALSDEEILFELIISQGPDVLSRVNGDFAGAIWNKESKQLTLFRDHMGIRPLFYYKSVDFTCFSSDMRGILAADCVPGDINPEWLYRSFNGYDTMDYCFTEVKDVFQVKPASYIVISTSASGLVYDEHNYWTLGKKKVRLSSKQEYIDKMRELITDSVKIRLDAFPGLIGAELSGGLDSGVIDILISRLGRKGIFYSWSHSPESLPIVPNDERSVIADICAQENIECKYGLDTIDMGPTSNVWKNHVKAGLAPSIDIEPKYNLALPLYLNTFIICETAQLMKENGANVVFSGHGGDEGVSHRCGPFELFYNKEYLYCFKELLFNHRNRKCPPYGALKNMITLARSKKKFTTTPFMDGHFAAQILKQSFIDQFKDKQMPVLTFAFDTVKYVYSGNTHTRPDTAALLGAYSGAQYVSPFLDYRAIDYAVSIPRHLYLCKGQDRHIFRQAFKDMMPKSLYECTAKDNPSEASLYNNASASKEDWFTAWEPQKRKLLDSLDWDYWGQYIDLQAVEAWDKLGKPSDEDKQMYMDVARKLRECSRFQNVRTLVKNHG